MATQAPVLEIEDIEINIPVAPVYECPAGYALPSRYHCLSLWEIAAILEFSRRRAVSVAEAATTMISASICRLLFFSSK
jgi:hypothetical protein